MSLAKCLNKHHELLRDFDTSEIVADARAYVADGMAQREAEIKAVDDKLAEIASERARIEKDILSQYKAMRPDVFEAPAAKADKPTVNKPAEDVVEAHPAKEADKPVEKAPELDAADEQDQNAPGKIENFGEHIPGSRKEKAAALRDAVSRELSDDAIASMPLSKIWPKESIDQIEDVFVAAVAHAARAEVPTKPKTAYKVRAWVEKVKLVRGLASMVLDGTVTKERFAEGLKSYRLEHFAAKVSLLEQIDRASWDRIGKVSEYPDAYTYDADGNKEPVPQVTVEIDERRERFSSAISVADVIDKVNEKLGIEVAARKMEFEVRGREGAFFINKKGDPLYRKLKTFTTGKEALDYRKSNYTDLLTAWESVKESDNVKETDVRGKENRPRTAEDWRNGKDVSPDEFHSAFSFKGVQFGEWVSQGKNAKERQGMLNEAYDALMDLADIINVPPKALSLNGSLGLGFGARGSGWASAHFEPGMLVINLTKTRGAGSLAHEWFHATDNYFQRERISKGEVSSRLEGGHSGDFITYNPENYYVHKQNGLRLPQRAFNKMIEGGSDSVYGTMLQRYRDRSQWEVKEGVRAEVAEAFADLVKTLNDSPMAKRASLIDKGKSGGYWSSIIERGARSFENYVIHKMMLKGYHNDYLANVTPASEFVRDAGRYPYLLEGEIQPVAEAFDNLFATIQTKETDQGVALYSRADQAPQTAGLSIPEAKKELTAAFGAKAVESLAKQGLLNFTRTTNDWPQYLQAGLNGTEDAVYHNGKAYYALDKIQPGQIVSRVLHEIGEHHGLEYMLGEKAYTNLMKRIKTMRDLKSVAVNEAWDTIERNYKHLKPNSPQFMGEVIARLGEDQKVQKSSWWREFKERIQAFLLKIGLERNWVKNISTNDINLLIRASVLSVSRENKPSVIDGAALPEYSRESEHLSQDAPRRRKVNEYVADALTTSKKFGVINHYLNSPYHLSQKSPEFKPVFDKIQDMIEDTSQFAMEAADVAPHVLPRLESLWDAVNPKTILSEVVGQRRRDMKVVSKAIFDGTLEETRFSDAELKGMMSDRQAGLYKEYLGAVNKSLDDLTTSVMFRMGKAFELNTDSIRHATPESAHEQLTGDAQAKADDLLPQIKSATQEVAAANKARISVADPVKQLEQQNAAEAATKTQDDLRAKHKSLLALIEDLDETLTRVQELQEQGYAPLMRFGKYTVTMKNDGKVTFFSMHENERDANRMARDLREAYPKSSVSTGNKSNKAFALYKGTSPDSLEVFAQVMGASSETVYQEYLKQAVSDRSVLKRLIHRKGTEGYSQDGVRVLAQFVTSNARFASNNYHWADALKAREAIPQGMGDVITVAQELLDYTQDPTQEAPRIRALLFIMFLGGAIDSAMLNLTQTGMSTLPYLSKWGAAKAALELTKAALIATRIPLASESLRAALAKAKHTGVTSPHEIHQLYAEMSRTFGNNAAIKRALTIWGSAFAIAEQFNRKVSFIAAFNIGQGLTKEQLSEAGVSDAYEFAVKAVKQTQFLYNKGNKPKLFRGPIGAPIFTFKMFPLSMIELFSRQPVKVKLMMFALWVLAAGVQGLPGAEDAEDIIDTIGQRMGHNTNSKRALRDNIKKWAIEYLGEEFGTPFAEIMTSGISGLSGMPIDVSARMGMSNLIPGTGVFKVSNEKDNALREVAEILGAAGGLAKQVFEAIGQFQTEGVSGVIKGLAPRGARNVLKGLDMWEMGQYRDAGGRKVIDTTKTDAVLKAAGIQPGKVAKRSLETRLSAQDVATHKQTESRIASQWAQGIYEAQQAKNDAAKKEGQEKRDRAKKNRDDWNERNPDWRIVITKEQLDNRVADMKRDGVDRAIKRAPAEIRGRVANELRP